MKSTANAGRVRVERGIYVQPNGKYAICAWHAGKLHFRTIEGDLPGARQLRAALIAALRRGAGGATARTYHHACQLACE
jgi:hypothetical protein